MSATPLSIQEGISSKLSSETKSRAHPLHVLTLTPFYPSLQNLTQGCFISEPIQWTEKLGVANHVIAVRPFYRAKPQPINPGVPYTSQSYFALPGNLGLPTAGNFLASRLTETVTRLHEREPFDVIHAHAPLPSGYAAEGIARKLNIPFVVSVHGLDVFFRRQAGAVLGAWCARACAHVYERAAAVICISEKVRSFFDGDIARKCRVVHNGVDSHMFAPALESTSPLTVLSVGNLIAIKGHALLLRAFARVLRKIPDCQLEIIGEGKERQNLLRLAKDLRIEEKTKFLGRQNRNAVATAIQRCAVFALPSSYEGLGCVYLEAMASGKPVIGCRGQGIAEVVEHGRNGLLIPPESESELADALCMLLRNPTLRRAMGSKAHQTIVQDLTLEHQARRLLEIYRECAA